MTGTYPPDDTPWRARVNDTPKIGPTRRRIRAAWNVLRGRPTLYRARIISAPDHTHIGAAAPGGVYSAECQFVSEGAYLDAAGLLLERLGRRGIRQAIDGR